MKKITIILGAILMIVVSITFLNPLQEQIENVSRTEGLVEIEERNYYIWGDNVAGLFGLGDDTDSLIPLLMDIPNDELIKQVEINRTFMGVVTESGKLYMWGDNSKGQIGDGTNDNKLIPTLIDIPNNETVKSLHLGTYYTIVITNENNIYAWGYNTFGSLGVGDTVNRNIPTLVTIPNGNKPKEIFLGDTSNYLITEEDNFYVWGTNSNGQLGDGTNIHKLVPTLITINNEIVTKVGVKNSGQNYTASIITESGKVFTTGNDQFGTLGNGILGDTNIFTEININGEHAIEIFSGDNTYAIKTLEGNIYIWGKNDQGQLGLNSTSNINIPTLLEINNEIITNIKFGYSHSGMITESGNVYMVGDNQEGQLGDGTTIDKRVPQLLVIPNNETVKSLNITSYHNLLITQEGNLYTWGYNVNGQVGNNTIESQFTPLLIPFDYPVEFSYLADDLLSRTSMINTLNVFQELQVVENDAIWVSLLPIIPFVIIGAVIFVTIPLMKQGE